MWKVKNQTNVPVLKKFNDLVVNNIILIIEEFYRKNPKISNLKNFWKTTILYKNLDLENKTIIDKTIEFKDTTKKSLISKIEKILKLRNVNFKALHSEYINQNESMYKNYYKIYEYQEEPDEIKELFCDHFYDFLFPNINYWNEVFSIDYSKQIFITNFKTENELTVCPYCDTETILNSETSTIDHFFPKEKFPFLSMNPNNMIISCWSCQRRKNQQTPFPSIISPYLEEIGDAINYTMNDNDFQIKLSPLDPQKKGISQYLIFLKSQDLLVYGRLGDMTLKLKRCYRTFEF
jgi:5-methylcytosine-specific restriction endonuclease McrA